MINVYVVLVWLKDSHEYVPPSSSPDEIIGLKPYSSMEKAKEACEQSEYWKSGHEWRTVGTNEIFQSTNTASHITFEIEGVKLDDWVDKPLEGFV